MRLFKVDDVESFFAKIFLKPLNPDIRNSIERILLDVQKKGDSAIRANTRTFDGVSLRSFRVSKSEIKNAYTKVSKDELDAIHLVKTRLEKSESTVKSLLKNITINHDGTKISKKFVPIQSVGCYVPGGQARYPSSAIMSVIPAKVAGVKRIVVTSPPNSEGGMQPLTIVAADLCGATEIYKIGGAQAIAALSYGTKSIGKVDKIVGPGGRVVAIAKFLISVRTEIDMYAGPTELGIIADDMANSEFIALDLISQAEHGNDTFCFLLTKSEVFAKLVKKSLCKLLLKIERTDIVKSSLKKNGFIGICKSDSDMIKLANLLAPEHLQIMTRNPKLVSSKINSAGLVLQGDYTPSSASDYIFGSNHILPTLGLAKTRGSLSVLDFIKTNTQITSSKKSLSRMEKHVRVLTQAEGLPNHYEAVRGRLD